MNNISRKRHNKVSTNVIYYINDNMSDTKVCGSVKQVRNSRKLGATGTSTGRRPPRSPRIPGRSGWTPPRRRELSSSRVSPKENERKRIEEARVSTQLVLNKYNTNYEAVRLADSTALAFKSWQSFIKAIYYKLMNYHKSSYIAINQIIYELMRTKPNQATRGNPTNQTKNKATT